MDRRARAVRLSEGGHVIDGGAGSCPGTPWDSAGPREGLIGGGSHLPAPRTFLLFRTTCPSA
jgi:hypothetical protein